MNKHKFKSGDQGIITYKSSNPFEFFHILNSKKQDEQDMFGTLIFPEKKKNSYPQANYKPCLQTIKRISK